jgi:hypothetical protein
MKKVIRMTESDLTRLVKRVIQEQATNQNNQFLKFFTDQGIPEDMVPESCKNPNVSNVENIRPGLCASEMMKSELYKKPEWQNKIKLAIHNHQNLMIDKLSELIDIG